ncbi:MAG: TIGR03086 family metal-binding protein [Pseudonocardiales bacterium]
MTDTRAATALIGGMGLLERAVNYALGSLHLITPHVLSYATPCAGWDVRALLAHLDESFQALREAADLGRVDVAGPGAAGGADPIAGVRDRACLLVGAWANAGEDRHVISIAGSPLTAGIVTGTGAIEAAVHGWDLARACGRQHPIPASLAEEMLGLAPLLVTDDDRPARFAAAIDVGPSAGPGDQLVAFLGRPPR